MPGDSDAMIQLLKGLDRRVETLQRNQTAGFNALHARLSEHIERPCSNSKLAVAEHVQGAHGEAGGESLSRHDPLARIVAGLALAGAIILAALRMAAQWFSN